jgi:hypothetical protein
VYVGDFCIPGACGAWDRLFTSYSFSFFPFNRGGGMWFLAPNFSSVAFFMLVGGSWIGDGVRVLLGSMMGCTKHEWVLMMVVMKS